jgi:inorganic phosphate transporter, PiT family
LLSDQGISGVVVLMVLLAVACSIIYFFSRRNKISHANVTDSHEVLVLAAATPPSYDDDPRLEAPQKPKKIKRPKAKSAA